MLCTTTNGVALRKSASYHACAALKTARPRPTSFSDIQEHPMKNLGRMKHLVSEHDSATECQCQGG